MDERQLVLLCGGIGSGKSTASGILAALGATVVSADEAGHRVLEPGGPAVDAVARRWPGAVREGRIDRRSLGRIVFADPEALEELEALTHPEIRRLVAEEVAAVNASVVVVELPLLSDFLGPGWIRVVVDAPDDVRRTRLLAIGMDEHQIDLRMAAQPSRKEWLAAADLVIENTGDLGHLEAECRRVWSILTVR